MLPLLPCPGCGALGWLFPCSECGYDQTIITLVCRHGEPMTADAGDAMCNYCCTPYIKGRYLEHVRTSPSHLTEKRERALDRKFAQWYAEHYNNIPEDWGE